MKIKIGKTKSIYKGREFCVKAIDWQLNGVKRKKEVLVYPNTVGVLPFLGKDKVVLIKQYRFPAGKEIWEVPAGQLKKGEKPEKGAVRETKEETGFKVSKLKRLSGFYSSPGHSTEHLTLFKAEVQEKEKQHLDEDEYISKVKIFTFKEAVRMVNKGEIVDVKTILAVKLEELNRA